AKNPDERYQSAAELMGALQSALAGQPASSVTQDAPTIRENAPLLPPRAEAKPAAPPNALPPTVGMRVLKLLDSMAFFVAPLIGRQRVQMNQDTEDRRELLASVMAVVGLLLAALQLLAGTLDLISRTFAPIIQLSPLLIIALLALGGVATWNIVRLTASPRRRRRALLVLGIVAVGALAWGGWLVYDKTRPPAGPIVVIADFQRCKTCDETEYGQRIYRYVKLETDRLKLPNLEVRYVLESYADAATARARGADYKATLVIWGSYDKTGLIPHFELLRAPDTLPQHFIQPEELSVAEFHLQGGDREVAFMALLGLGLIRYAEGDYATALSLYDAGLQTLSGDAGKPAPNAEVAYFYKALSQYASGEAWDVIADNLKKVVAIKPNWADAHYLLAVTYLSACKPDGSNAYDLALTEGETAIQVRADANNYWVRGEAQSRLGRWAEAAKSFEQSLKLKDDPGVRSALIIAYRKLGRQDLADQESKHTSTVLSSAKDEVGKLRDEAYQFYYQGRLADATLRYQQAISRAVELKRSNTVQSSLYMSLGDAHAAQEQYAEALFSYLKAESLWGKNWSGYYALAFVYQRLGKDNEAIGAYQKAIDNSPCDSSAHVSLADLYAKQGDSSRAVAEYRQAISANPSNGLAYVSMAIQLEIDGKTNDANDALQKALPLLAEQLRQEPTNANLAYVLGSTYYRVNQFASALVAFQKYATLAPNDRQSHYWIGAALYELKRFPEAIAELEQANKAQPNSTLTLSKLADAYREVNRIEDAIAAYQQIVALDPKDANAWLQLGQIADQQQRWADAAKAYETLVTLIPKDAQAHTALAFAYFNLNRTDEALKEFRAAVMLLPNVGYYQTNLALALETARQHDEAITVAQRALQLDATQIVAHYVLGLAYKAKGDKAKAASEFQVVAQSSAVSAALKQAAEQELRQLGA
ncbi:MAG: tetratricopeptide repeat protein, partial [Chloroflexota bacterium]